MVSTTLVLKASDSHKNLVVSRSKPCEVFRFQCPRHTPVQQGLNHLTLQQSKFTTNAGSRPIIQLRAEPVEVCPHETDPPVAFELEVRFSRILPPVLSGIRCARISPHIRLCIRLFMAYLVHVYINMFSLLSAWNDGHICIAVMYAPCLWFSAYIVLYCCEEF